MKELKETAHNIADYTERAQYRLEMLLDITNAMSSETELDNLLISIMDKSKDALEADRCSIFLLDKEKSELWTQIAHGINGNEIRVPANMGLVGHVALSGKVINVENAYNDPRFDREIDKKTGYKTKTLLSVPMKNRRGEIMGVFQALNKQEGMFTAADEELLMAVAYQAAISIENTLLYEEQKHVLCDFLETLVASHEIKDRRTHGCSTRIKNYVKLFARQLHVNKSDVQLLQYAALLTNVESLGELEKHIMRRNRISEEELEQVGIILQKAHALTAYIVQNFELGDIPLLALKYSQDPAQKVDKAVFEAQDIQLGARLLAIAIIYDAFTAPAARPAKLQINHVLAFFNSEAGNLISEKAVHGLFKSRLDKIISILLSNQKLQLSQNDKKFISQYTLHQLLQAYQRKNKTREDVKLIEKFSACYNLQSRKIDS